MKRVIISISVSLLFSSAFSQVYFVNRPEKKQEQKVLFRAIVSKEEDSELLYAYVRNCGSVPIQKHHKTNDLPKPGDAINITKTSGCEVQEWEYLK